MHVTFEQNKDLTSVVEHTSFVLTNQELPDGLV